MGSRVPPPSISRQQPWKFISHGHDDFIYTPGSVAESGAETSNFSTTLNCTFPSTETRREQIMAFPHGTRQSPGLQRRSEGRAEGVPRAGRSAGRFVGDRRYAMVTSDPLSGGELGLGSNLGISDLV